MSEKKRNVKRGYNFHRVTTMSIFAVLKNKVIKENNVVLDYHKPQSKSFILICNHTESMDPGYLMVALGRYIRFVASDHVLRMGAFGWIFKNIGGVIVKHRDRPSKELTDEIIRNVRAGIPVGLHAEGAMTVNGQTGFISEHTGQLVKDSGVALVTYKTVGGYLRCPRWSISKRKGPIVGHFVNEYMPEELAKLSAEEITEIIRRDTYVNVYEEQKKNPLSYEGENLAECVERILYICPKCGKVGTLHSKGDDLICDCGATVTMKADGFFHGEDVVYDNVLDWDMWQRGVWKEALLSAKDNEVIFTEDKQIVRKVDGEEETVLSENATLTLYKDRLEVKMENETVTMLMSEVKQASIAGKDTLLIVDGNIFLDIRPQIPRSSTKYVAAWRYLTGREYY